MKHSSFNLFLTSLTIVQGLSLMDYKMAIIF